MASRSTDPPSRQPRRGTDPPTRSGKGVPAAGRDRLAGPRRGAPGQTGGDPERDEGLSRGGMFGARAYTPRGRTLRDGDAPSRSGRGSERAGEQRVGEQRAGGQRERAGRGADPFRPALQVVAGVGRRAATRTIKRRTPARDRGAAPARDRGGSSAERGAATRTRRTVPAPRAKAAGRTRTKATARRSAPRRPTGPARLGDPRRRLRIGTVLALAMFAVVGIRLVALQVTDASAYAAEGLADRLHPKTLPAPRGAILDRDGNVLAHSVDARFIYVDPTRVSKPEQLAETLSPLLGLAKSELLPKIKRHKRPGGGQAMFEYLKRGVDVETAARIMALNLPGIGADRDEKRDVPGHDLAANLIGFTGEGLIGLEGIEARYDDVLRGVDGKLVYEVGNRNLNAEIPGGYRKETKAQPGRSLRLTIDRDLQFITQQTLTDRMKQVKAEFGGALVIDIKSGEVLAQASYPTYDALNPIKNVKPTDREDVATSVVVDPGSVHKALTVGAALDAGAITPDTVYTVGPTVSKGGYTFKDTHPHRAGTKIMLPELLAFSSNVGTIQVADRLGAEKLYEYQRRFGLGEPTGEGVLGEASGLVQPPKNWSGSSYGSIPIGHGVATTLMQMATVYATIANDGKYIQPHLVQATIAADGATVEPTVPRTRQVLSPSAARALRAAMEAVTTVPHATGLPGAITGYRVAAKTGTGKRVVNGRYSGGDVASFIGMAPAENPRYVVAVMAYTPSGGGGAISGPAFRDIMASTLAHYKLPPSGTRPPKFVLAQ